MHHSSRGHCGCLWPPASFPSSQAKSRVCYQEQKMCHLCCISFPFLHLFPARCASEITALHAEAGAQGRQRPCQPYRCLAGRKEIRKFAEIFGQQNKHFSCQEPNGQLSKPAAICMAPLTAAVWTMMPTLHPHGSPRIVAQWVPVIRDASNIAVGGMSGDEGSSAAPTCLAWHNGCSTQSEPKPLPMPCPWPAGSVPGLGSGAGACGQSMVLVGTGVCEGKWGRGPVLFTEGRQMPVTQPAAAFLPGHGPGRSPPGANTTPWSRPSCGVSIALCEAMPGARRMLQPMAVGLLSPIEPQHCHAASEQLPSSMWAVGPRMNKNTQ